MYIINPKEFTKMREIVYPKEVRKRKRMEKEDTEQEKNWWNYLKFAILITTWCTNDLNNPIKGGTIILSEKTSIRDLSNLKVQIN